MYGLLYPAVLGTIFVTFIGVDLTHFDFSPRLLFGVVFIVHWVTEFALATTKDSDTKYQLYEFISDLLMISSMYFAFYTLPESSSPNAEYIYFYISLSFLSLVFCATDILRWKLNNNFNKFLFSVDLAIFVVAIALVTASSIKQSLNNSSTMAYFFIAFILLASLFALSNIEKRGGNNCI